MGSLQQNSTTFSNDIISHTYISLFISLLFVFLGYYLFELKSKKINVESKPVWDKMQVRVVRTICMYFIYITFLPALAITFEKVIFVQSYNYSSYYTDFYSNLPLFVQKVAILFELSLFFFLATMPTKSEVKWPLILFFIIGLLSLGFGQRNGAVLNTIFILIYLFLRNSINPGGTSWISVKQVIFIIIMIPFLLSFLYIFSFTRLNQNFSDINIWNDMLNFFYQQGGSVDIISYTRIYHDKIPDHVYYTFGSIIDMFQQNAILKLFDVYPILKPHTTAMALEGNSFGQSISYFISPSNYLSGIGYGSCYIAEVWQDFGYIGIAIANFTYGAIMALILKWCRKNIWLTAFSFFMITGILYAPRAEAISFLTNCFSVTYILFTTILYFYSKNKARDLIRKLNRSVKITPQF